VVFKVIDVSDTAGGGGTAVVVVIVASRKSVVGVVTPRCCRHWCQGRSQLRAIAHVVVGIADGSVDGVGIAGDRFTGETVDIVVGVGYGAAAEFGDAGAMACEIQSVGVAGDGGCGLKTVRITRESRPDFISSRPSVLLERVHSRGGLYPPETSLRMTQQVVLFCHQRIRKLRPIETRQYRRTL